MAVGSVAVGWFYPEIGHLVKLANIDRVTKSLLDVVVF